MLRRLTKTRAVFALGVIAALVVAGAAVAYFTTSGSGSGSASVGSHSPFTVTVAAPSGGPLYPGAGSETLSYTITNAGSGTQNLSKTTAAVAVDTNGDAVHNGTSITDCKAAWFSPVDNPPTYGALAGGATATGSVTVTMPDNTTDNQDACQGATPDITVSAS